MTGPVTALRTSVGRLHHIAQALPEHQLGAPAYPSEWSIADVLSHLGSGAVIMRRRLGDALGRQATPDEFASAVWDTWNAKPPTAQRQDALEADAEFLAAIEAVDADQREGFAMSMGPMTLDFDAFVRMRLNEHVFHTWDIEVAGDATATVPTDLTELVVDNLELTARFTAKPTGDTARFAIATIDPARRFTIELAPESVVLAASTDTAQADLELPAEAFARLVYGRLDPEHTPAGIDGAALEVLRSVFPGP